jgi:hypothetical protein
MLPFFDIVGVVWAYTALYVFAGVLTFIIRVPQPGHTREEKAMQSRVAGQRS